MAFPTATGVPSHSGVLIPEIWAGEFLVKFYDATVFAAISNTDYEGDIKDMGDTVHIITTPDIVIRDYYKGMTLQAENPEPSKVDLLINKGKYYNFAVNKVDQKQANKNFVEKWAEDASEQMKISIDASILADVYSDAHASNSGATAGRKSSSVDLGATGAPLALDKTNIVDNIVDCGLVLDEQSIPESGRWLVLPAWACARIKKSELKDASLTGDGVSMLRNGRIGMVDRFTIYMSNNIATATDGAYTAYNAMFGHKAGLTFASQLTEKEEVPNPNDFGKLLRGLQVYGYKVVKPSAIGHLYCRAA